MGRRKIEIKAIKDDRNRSVTFLKRKGGLFKKAHELSVLCSVDVAVIIFGNNKKLYEYSSSDLGEILTRYQYYGGANEHKGPADFSGKDKLDDDDDDDDNDDASGPSHHGSVEPQMMSSQFQTQVTYQHMRHQTPSASPPIPPGSVFPHHHHQPRKQTPQSQLPDKRPISRNANTRPSSNLVPQISQTPNGYAYMSNQTIYNPQAVNLSSHSHAIPPHMQGPPIQNHPMQNSQYSNYPSPSSHPQLHPHQHQIHHNYQEDQRKVSIPNSMPQERLTPRPVSSPQPPLQHIPDASSTEVEVKQEPQNTQQIPVPVKRVSSKSRSIFTPIDESRSILSQHWASSTSKIDVLQTEANNSGNQLQSLETNNGRPGNFTTTPVGTPSQTGCHTPNSAPESLMRSSSNNSVTQASAKRPVLKVQIPEEASDGGSPIVDSLSSPSATNLPSSHSRQNGNTADAVSSSLVLPPPSPSAGTLLSAGASGPPNPFARPPVSQNPQSNANGSSSNNVNGASTVNGNTNNNNANATNSNHVIDTPVSALPSRFMTNEFLPSPSSFYPEWNFRGGDGNTLPSPLNFATPVVGTGPSFLRDDAVIKDLNRDLQAKRNIKAEDPDGQGPKRLKKE